MMGPSPEALRALREELGLSVRQAAARLGVDGTNYRKWEAGTRGIQADRWPAMIAALRAPPEPSAGYVEGALFVIAELRARLEALEHAITAAAVRPLHPDDAAADDDAATPPAVVVPARSSRRRRR